MMGKSFFSANISISVRTESRSGMISFKYFSTLVLTNSMVDLRCLSLAQYTDSDSESQGGLCVDPFRPPPPRFVHLLDFPLIFEHFHSRFPPHERRTMTYHDALSLVHEYTKNEALRKHMYAVEAAMRAY